MEAPGISGALEGLDQAHGRQLLHAVDDVDRLQQRHAFHTGEGQLEPLALPTEDAFFELLELRKIAPEERR